MERQAVKSSNIASIGYEKSEGILEVQFNNGRLYQYYNVPFEVYTNLMNAVSHGKYFKQYIVNGGYRYSEIK